MQEREKLPDADARARILDASLRLFSQKGYDAASVSEIAAEAHVTKALIYYYFKSKEAILESLFAELFQNLDGFALNFVNTAIVDAIKAGTLDIQTDRFHFNSQGALEHFLAQTEAFLRALLDYAISQRHILRILSIESLRNEKHRRDLLRILDMTKYGGERNLVDIISSADSDFNYSRDMDIFKLFFMIFPIISFASYCEDYAKATGHGVAELGASFLNLFRFQLGAMVDGNDLRVRELPAYGGL
ncbi:MAG: helix-turn-helix domain-containing protein [Oscillospiraceae bacterium]